jgi:hypothetical protein
MAQSSKGAIFGWYVSKDKTFNGIFLKSGSFDGIEPIFPNYHGNVAKILGWNGAAWETGKNRAYLITRARVEADLMLLLHPE